MPSNKTEQNELKRIGAKAHKNSGRGMIKGDGSLPNYVVDVKEFSKTFGVSQDIWAKICMDTIRVNKDKEPVIYLVLGETNKTRLAIIAWDEFEELNRIRDLWNATQ